MIQLRTILKPADNSGAKRLKVIHVYGGSRKRFGHVGDIVLASVDQAEQKCAVKDSELVKVVIVRTRKEPVGLTALMFALMITPVWQ